MSGSGSGRTSRGSSSSGSRWRQSSSGSRSSADGGRNPNLLATALGVLILGVAMTPLIWMRYEIPLIRGRDRAVRRAFAVIGVGCLWSVVALVVGVWLLAALGVE